VTYRTPHGKDLGAGAAARMGAFEIPQTRQESMRLFHSYFFYPIQESRVHMHTKQ